jgi:hypothetical protein
MNSINQLPSEIGLIGLSTESQRFLPIVEQVSAENTQFEIF